MFGPLEIGIVAAIVLVLFGGSKLPIFSRNLGKAVRDFKHALRGDDGIEVRPVDGKREEDSDAVEKESEPS